MRIRKVPASWLDSPRQRGRKSVRSRVASKSAGDELGANDQSLEDSRTGPDPEMRAHSDNHANSALSGRLVGPLLAAGARSR